MLKSKYVSKILVILTILLPGLSLAARNDTPDYWQCQQRVGGQWQFGRAPSGCNVDTYSPETYVEEQFGDLIFRDAATRADELKRYLEEMHAVLRDSVNYYLTQRAPSATAEEHREFLKAYLAMAHQESFWSHYRLAADENLKMMRGDYGHGHGIMQVDDRWHFGAIQDGTGWRLIGNVFYALDQFYTAWQRAKTASCVSSNRSWEQISRATYSAYNGGMGKICRWSNPNDPWAQNDVNYYEKYTGKTWERYIANEDKEAPISVPCFAEGNERCPKPGQVEEPVDLAGRIALTPTEQACVEHESALHCVNQYRDAACLRSLVDVLDPRPVHISADRVSEYRMETHDRHEVCRDMPEGVVGVGKFIQIKKDINMRRTPGGDLVKTLRTNGYYQVIDFEVTDAAVLNRYYLVQTGASRGYIFAGDMNSHAEWAVESTSIRSPAADLLIGYKLGRVKITASGGINMRQSPTGPVIRLLPKNMELPVQDVTIVGDDNKVYYRVSYFGQDGTIYGGHLSPDESYKQWATAR